MPGSFFDEVLTAPSLNDIIDHINRASDKERQGSIVDAAEAYFKALNKFWNAVALPPVGENRGDAGLFAILLSNGIPTADQRMLLESVELRHLTGLDPLILNHDELNRSGWRPGTEIAPSLQKAATEDHARLRRGLARYREGNEPEEKLLKKLANLLWVVRSNIAHGEKTPFGRDLEKRRRDETVCRHALPVQRLLVNLLLQRPDRKLVAYGSLVLGGTNHGVVSRYRGTWSDCIVLGRLSDRAGYPHFRWDPSGPEVPAKLLESSDLPEAWPDLDRFEGSEYARHLVPVGLIDVHAVAYTYESATG